MMKQTVKSFAVAGFLSGGLLFAGTFSDVPANHWAYKAIEQVTSAGIIQGYPGEKFQGDEKLNRYQMAIIISRILEAVSKGAAVPADASGILRKLTDEFGSELALTGARVNALEARTTFSEGRIDNLENEVYEIKEYGTGTEGGIHHSGSLGFMWQTHFANGLSETLSSDPTVRFNLNLSGRVNDKMDWGVGFSTASEGHPASSWRLFGDKLDGEKNPVGSAEVLVHKYFVTYKAKDFSFVLGKQENPFRSTELIFDKDIAPAGLSTEYRRGENWVFRAGQYYIHDGVNGSVARNTVNEDAFMFAHQAEYNCEKENNRKVTFRVSNFNFTGEEWLHPKGFGNGTINSNLINPIASATGNTFFRSNEARSGNYYNDAADGTGPHTGNASTVGRQGRLLSDFNLYNVYVEYKDLKNKENPWGVKFDYVVNDGAWNKDDEGFWFEVYQGELKEKGDIQYGFQLKKVDADAVLSFLNEDLLRTNTKATGIYVNSIIRENVLWFNNYHRFEAANGDSPKKEGLFRTGITYKF